ncbi:MAG: hypothetical protein NTX56_06155 [Proteobacteria bacterium]|nr:hypothetical protein [Pseudomonadota bacterium]
MGNTIVDRSRRSVRSEKSGDNCAGVGKGKSLLLIVMSAAITHHE